MSAMSSKRTGLHPQRYDILLISTPPTSHRYESALSHCMSQCPSHMCVECGRYNTQLAFLKEKIRFCCLTLCAIQTIRHCPWRHLGILDNMSTEQLQIPGIWPPNVLIHLLCVYYFGRLPC